MSERIQISESSSSLYPAAIILTAIILWCGWLWFVAQRPTVWQVLLLCALSVALRFALRDVRNHQVVSLDRRRLYVTDRRGEVVIPLTQVRHVRSALSGGRTPSWQIVVELRKASALGDRIVFTPNGAFQPRGWRNLFKARRWKEHPVAVEVLNRKYRRKGAT